jgi:RHS repeat-associated protein
VRGRDEGVAGAGAHKDEAPRHRGSAREGAPNQYDALGNLLGVWLPNGDVVEYLVDGLGRRVGKKLNGVVTRQWLYRDGLKPVAELNGAGTLQKQFVYGSHPLVPEFVVAGTNVYRVMSDQLGSPRVLIDVATGTVQQQMRHSAFGEALEDTNPGFTPFGFAGGMYDADTGLVRFGARDYDPSVGRWVSKDPIRFGGGQSNLFVYVAGDPVDFIDPTGEFLVLIGAGIGAAAGAAGAALTGSDVLAGAAAGAATGGFAGLTGGLSLVGQVAGGIGAGLVGVSINQAVRFLNGSAPVGPSALAAAVITGGGVPFAGALFRQLTQPGLSGLAEFGTRRVASSVTSFAVGTEVRNVCEDQ